MPRYEINSIDDPRIEVYRNLKHTNATRRAVVAEGGKLVRRLLASRWEVLSLLVGERYAEEFAALAGAELSIYVAADPMIEQIVGFNFHRGVLAAACRPAEPSLTEVLDRIGPRSTVVVCPQLQDPENLGTLIRTSLACGVDFLLLGAASADPFSRRVLRTSMGAVFELPVSRRESVIDDLERLRREYGFELVATVTDPGAQPLLAAARAPRTAILLGNEAHGLTDDVLGRCDRQVTIRMRPGVDSLNAAIAAGIVLHYFTAWEEMEH